MELLTVKEKVSCRQAGHDLFREVKELQVEFRVLLAINLRASRSEVG